MQIIRKNTKCDFLAVVKVAGKDKVVGGDDKSKTSTKKRFEDITFSTASIDQIKKFAEDNNLDIKDMRRDPNGNLSVDFDGSSEDMEKALTSDFTEMTHKTQKIQ